MFSDLLDILCTCSTTLEQYESRIWGRQTTATTVLIASLTMIWLSIVKINERVKIKQSVSRLVWPQSLELEQLLHNLHLAFIHLLLTEFSGIKEIAFAYFVGLKTLLPNASKGQIKIWLWVSENELAGDFAGFIQSDFPDKLLTCTGRFPLLPAWMP